MVSHHKMVSLQMVSPQNGDTQGDTLPPREATARGRPRGQGSPSGLHLWCFAILVTVLFQDF